jgi:hypothetical protein
MNPIDRAVSVPATDLAPGLTQAELAGRLGARPQQHCKLPAAPRPDGKTGATNVREGKLSIGHAKLLLASMTPPNRNASRR